MSQNREFVVTANWKMHKTVHEALLFMESLAAELALRQEKSGRSLQIFIAAPFTAIYPLASCVQKKGYPFHVGGQNMHEASAGAFTGEISALQLKEAGAHFVLIGHSERRQLFFEDDRVINKKIIKAILEKLQITLCIGETIEERERGETEAVLKRQLLQGLEGVAELSQVMLAYEPVWAIGAGKGAEPADIEKAHAFCRSVLREKWGKVAAEKVVIQYGGSVQPENTSTIIEKPNVDGLLVGGASLKVDSFSEIILRSQEMLAEKK